MEEVSVRYRKCKGCGEWKEVSKNYFRSKTVPLWGYSKCKTCFAKYTNPEKAKIYKSNYAKSDVGKQKKKEWMDKNRERLNKRSNEIRTTKRWEGRERKPLMTKEEKVESRKRHYYKNLEKFRLLGRIAAHKRRVRKNAAGGSFTKDDVRKLLTLQKCKCGVCKCDISNKYHIDHILPISLGGSNGPHNLQLLCPTCNLKKNSKHPIDFMQQQGYLI